MLQVLCMRSVPFMLFRCAHLMAILVIAFCFWGCTGTKSDDAVKPQGDEFISGTISGKDFTDSDPVAIYDNYGTSSSTLDLTSVFEISSSEGYLISVTLKNPKVGILSSKTGAVSGEISYVAGTIVSPVVREYSLSSSVESTASFTKVDTQGYAEGTLSLIGKASDGKTLSLTNGKFRVKL